MSYKKEQHSYNLQTQEDDYLFASSCHETTGLTPTIAHNDYEAESYQEITPYLPPTPPSTSLKTKK